jgi:carbamoyltransferase
MLETCQVISPIPLPAVTHVDGSARIQTVDRMTNQRFADLIEHFYKRTGCPILLNTSFNLRGEPIVCSIMDAISTFGRSKMDALVLEDFMLDRNRIPACWETFTRASPQNAQDYSVYTML